MIKKKVFSLLVLFALLISSVNAQKIEISSNKVDIKIFPGSEALFVLNVKNNQLREDIIKVSADPFSVYPFSDFIDKISVNPGQLKIPSNEEGVFEIKIKYSNEIKGERAYTGYLNIQSLFNEDIKESYGLTSFVMSSGNIISIKTNIPENIIAGKDISFDATFKNNVNEDFDDLDFLIISSYFNDQHKLSLKKNEEITKNYILNLKPETPAGDYSLFLRILKNGELKGENEIRLKVELTKDLQEKINRERGFLKTKVVLSKINNGNVRIDKIVKYPINGFERFFTETSLKADYAKENNEKYLVWNLVVKPGERADIVIETDYTSFFFTILALIILIGVVYYIKTKTLRIIKKVIKTKDKDGKHHLKVILNLQNYTNKNIENLKIIDLLPGLIKHYSDFGTLEPKNIQQGSKGLRFIWEINKLHSGEERIISYKIEPQLNLHGNIRLPAAILQFSKNNKLVIRKSNITHFLVERKL